MSGRDLERKSETDAPWEVAGQRVSRTASAERGCKENMKAENRLREGRSRYKSRAVHKMRVCLPAAKSDKMWAQRRC